MLTLTTHSGLRIGMLSCFSVRLRQWDAGLTWPEWDITQNMNLPIIMFIPHVHVCVQGHDHVCTSLNQHEIHSNRERSHSKIWFSIYWNARISISHDSKNKKYTRVINFGCWQVTCHQSESVKYYTSPESSDICSLQQPSQSSVSWGRNIRQLFGRKYLTILIAYLALLTVLRSARERRSIIFAKLMSDPGSEVRVKDTNIYC